jgi:uncharacterized protein (DUF427 family)
MAKAIWENTVLAESDRTIEVEGNQYFPPDAIRQEFLKPNDHHTTCPWKGLASYYDVEIDGKKNSSAAWYYPDPKPAAKQIKDHVAFWRGVRIEK